MQLHDSIFLQIWDVITWNDENHEFYNYAYIYNEPDGEKYYTEYSTGTYSTGTYSTGTYSTPCIRLKWGGELAYCVTRSLDGSWSTFVYGVLICIYVYDSERAREARTRELMLPRSQFRFGFLPSSRHDGWCDSIVYIYCRVSTQDATYLEVVRSWCINCASFQRSLTYG